MTIDVIASTLPTVDLSRLENTAALMTRRDRKYLLPADQIDALANLLPNNALVLDVSNRRVHTYRSTYFDTEHGTAYALAARRRPGRFKVRIRCYVDSGSRYLEAKVKDARGRTIKDRIAFVEPGCLALSAANRAWLREHRPIAPFVDDLFPCVTITYRRCTLLLPDAGARVTIDTDLALHDPEGSAVHIPDWCVIETKSPGAATAADRALWSLGHRPRPMSKFAIGMALIDPGLPRNRWSRICRLIDAASAKD
jgi:hypothetical protein